MDILKITPTSTVLLEPFKEVRVPSLLELCTALRDTTVEGAYPTQIVCCH